MLFSISGSEFSYIPNTLAKFLQERSKMLDLKMNEKKPPRQKKKRKKKEKENQTMLY